MRPVLSRVLLVCPPVFSLGVAEACGGPEFTTGGSDIVGSEAGDARSEGRAPIICNNCGDPSPTPMEAGDEGDEGGDGALADTGTGIETGDATAQDGARAEATAAGADAGCATECPAPDQCHADGICNPRTGSCTYANKPDDTTCNADDNACTTPDVCLAGVCAAGPVTSCNATDECHIPGTCSAATGLCSPSPPAPNTTPCFTAQHAASALCDGLGTCNALTCATGFVNDRGACKLPNCTGVLCGGSDGAGGICTGANGTCSVTGQHCNSAGQCVCDGTSCSGCCDSNGQCNASSDTTCGISGSACQACSMMFSPFTACSGGSCKRIMLQSGCVTDADCVPGGCFNGACLGTIGMAGVVSCGDAALQCLNGCSSGTGSAPAPTLCGNQNTAVFISCDAPNDCGAGQDCCHVTSPAISITQTCAQQSTPGVLGSGCPVPSQSNQLSVSIVCDPRNPVCPAGMTCKPAFPYAYLCS
jgi:hypothetical protein